MLCSNTRMGLPQPELLSNLVLSGYSEIVWYEKK